MLKYLLRQTLNQIRSQSWLVHVEVLIVVGIIALYLAGRFQHIFRIVVEEKMLTQLVLALVSVQIVIFFIFLSSVFIVAYLIPRQKTIFFFMMVPMSSPQVRNLLYYYMLQYQILYFLLLLPLFIALAMSSGIFPTLLAVFKVLFYVHFLSNFVSGLYTRVTQVKKYIILSITILSAYVIAWILLLYLDKWILLADGILVLLFIGAGIRFWKQDSVTHVETLFPYRKKTYNLRKINHPMLDINLPANVQRLFVMVKKELYSVWRNYRYRRLKALTMAGFIFGLFLLSFPRIEYPEIWMLLFTIVIIWLHYGTSFNEKYVIPDPDWYYKTTPFTFHQLWLSKFIAEFAFVGGLIVIFFLFTLLNAIPLLTAYNLLLIVFTFSIFILVVMVTFRVMFYDNPRLAGYAFHFMIVFISVMSVNFRLVGPLIGFLLIGYYFYKSYRYFKT